MNGHGRRFRSGATVIELVSALVILGVALPPLMRAFIESSTQTIGPSNATVAAFLAIEKMEQITARRYSSTTGFSQVTAEPAAGVPGFPIFTRSVTVSNDTAGLLNIASDSDYKRVRVIVSWNGGANHVQVERLFVHAWQ